MEKTNISRNYEAQSRLNESLVELDKLRDLTIEQRWPIPEAKLTLIMEEIMDLFEVEAT